ncbi:MAG: hypothetical protein EOP90_13775 [Lysobacteraceae bacterium]|nr:MAG: hypothetical protein EOP90_13775 [Xanthomonadaceae bacterium]
MIQAHREPPPANPAQHDDAGEDTTQRDADPPQAPGFDERTADRGHGDNTNVEGGPPRADAGPVDTEGT